MLSRLFKYAICVSALLHYSISSNAQNIPKGLSLEGSFHFGKALKHRDYITVDMSNYVYGAEFNAEFETYGKKHWHQRCGYPRWGIALSYLHYGNNKEIGHNIGIMPNITADFFQKGNWRIFGRLGVGLSIITKPYHIINNPQNNIIGSYLNNITAFRVGFGWRVHENIEIRPSASFTHSSNAASQFPNLGINVPSLHIGICYTPNPIEKTDIIKVSKDSLPKHNWRPQFSVIGTIGYREQGTQRGPKYPVYTFMADAGIYITRNQKIKAGVEIEYLQSTHEFMRHNGGYGDNLFLKSSLVALYVTHEWMFGRFSINTQAGFYVSKAPILPWFMYIRFMARYHFLDPFKSKVAPFIGISMKAHKAVAKYYAFSLGVSF
ncbi:MAG: acyloxyacyl hydrolase [Aureispira sp.]|nr:acyloxyacyl hydrolase [Aureispira sp.]